MFVLLWKWVRLSTRLLILSDNRRHHHHNSNDKIILYNKLRQFIELFNHHWISIEVRWQKIKWTWEAILSYCQRKFCVLISLGWSTAVVAMVNLQYNRFFWVKEKKIASFYDCFAIQWWINIKFAWLSWSMLFIIKLRAKKVKGCGSIFLQNKNGTEWKSKVERVKGVLR